MARHGWLKSATLAGMAALAIVLARSLLVVSSHSPTYDEQYHLYRGLALLHGVQERSQWNDPPPGAALIALPIWVLGLGPTPTSADLDQPLMCGRASVQTQQYVVAAWKSVLLLPLLVVAFVWARRLYGCAAAWLALGMLTFEPTLAAMIPLATPDSLAVMGIVVAMYASWLAIERPTTSRLMLAGGLIASAMLLKHTAIILPMVASMCLVIGWRQRCFGRASWRTMTRRLSVLVLTLVGCLWALTGFDISRPDHWGRQISAEYRESWSVRADVINASMMRRWPAGMYLGSVAEAYNHGQEGHPAYLKGEMRDHGWWHYFPVVATYKVPLGFAAVVMLAIVSLAWQHPRLDELCMLLAAVAWAMFVTASGIHIGFRHALPAYVPILLLGSRVCGEWGGPRSWATVAQGLAVAAFIAGALHVSWAHPNYLSYINRPMDRPHLMISDSNVDWGQALKELGRWHKQQANGESLAVAYYGDRKSDWVGYYLGHGVRQLQPGEAMPSRGLLALSATMEAQHKDFERLTRQTSQAVLAGGAMRVYRLDQD